MAHLFAMAMRSLQEAYEVYNMIVVSRMIAESGQAAHRKPGPSSKTRLSPREKRQLAKERRAGSFRGRNEAVDEAGEPDLAKTAGGRAERRERLMLDFKYEIDQDKCIGCEMCAEVCSHHGH